MITYMRTLFYFIYLFIFFFGGGGGRLKIRKNLVTEKQKKLKRGHNSHKN